MHESSTAGGGDDKPREDGARTDGARTDGVPKDATAQGDAAGGGNATVHGDGTVQNGGVQSSGVQDSGVQGGPAAGGTEADGAAPGGPAGEDTTAAAQSRPRRSAPERSQAEQDAIFAALVAQFDDPVDLTNPNWPEVENLRAQNELKGGYKDGYKDGGPKAGQGDPDDLSDLAPQPRARSGRPVLPASAPGPRDFELAEDTDEGHFVPPEPPPLPPADTTAKFAWLAVLGGPALLLIDAVVWREISGWPAWVGVTAFLGGFVTLVARMKDRDEDEPEDPDHGAVV
ncbi:hypothetical protein AB0F71_04170 [Kitasatospora sp. NPDC028055]|uniref:hypothetical protein n=1 Tax=Kitasatospora sp. NPDC028055 TaxID=3155653 RepID=UPI0033CE4DF5